MGMTAVDQRVSIWAKLLGSALVLLVLLLNVFTVPYWQSLGWYPVLPSRHLHNNDLSYFLPLALNLIWGVTGLVLLLGKRPLKVVFQTSLAYNLLLLLAGFLLYFIGQHLKILANFCGINYFRLKDFEDKQSRPYFLWPLFAIKKKNL